MRQWRFRGAGEAAAMVRPSSGAYAPSRRKRAAALLVFSQCSSARTKLVLGSSLNLGMLFLFVLLLV